ncbi:hypothetical protein PAND9192_04064 [Photobacterium andalusiense]|uniref:Uncharacterized protein n=1 Tax=Photobacterium andalusiense TaxID=2204296 RepID=A0A1Y6MTH0_9GAMM|nr:hypothetical protein PAND9192_04064 [Photobacterium andalusiense]
MKRTGLAIPKISATLGVTDRTFKLIASRLNIPDAKNPHIADEASLCCEADGTCHSENQRDPRRANRLFILIASRLDIPDAKNPHIADEASLCCEADGTCHSENQRDPRCDRPNIQTFCI